MTVVKRMKDKDYFIEVGDSVGREMLARNSTYRLPTSEEMGNKEPVVIKTEETEIREPLVTDEPKRRGRKPNGERN